MFLTMNKETNKWKFQPSITKMNEDGTGIEYQLSSGESVKLFDTYSLDYRFGDTGHFRNLLTISTYELIQKCTNYQNFMFFNPNYDDDHDLSDLPWINNEINQWTKRIVMGVGTGLIRPNRLNKVTKLWSEWDKNHKQSEELEKERLHYVKNIKRYIKGRPINPMIEEMMCSFLFNGIVHHLHDDNYRPSNTLTFVDYPSEFGDLDFHKEKGTISYSKKKYPESIKGMTDQEILEHSDGSSEIEWSNLDMRRVS